MTSLKSETGIFLKEAVDEAICFGWIDGKMFSIDDEKYIIRMAPVSYTHLDVYKRQVIR